MNTSSLGLHNREWLSSILRRVRLSPVGAFASMLALNLMMDLPLALHFGALLPSAKGKGLFGEPADWLYELLIHPLILAYFCWIQRAGEHLFDEFRHRDILKAETVLDRVLTRSRRRLQSRWIPYICITLSLAFAGWFVLAFNPSFALSPYESPPYASWVAVHSAIVWVRAPVVFIVFYALTFVIYDLGVIIVALNELLGKQSIQVEPFNPDKAGGLGFVGGFSADLGYLIGAVGLLLSVRMIEAPNNLLDVRNYVLIFGCVWYVVLAPVVFLLPLWAAHTAMVRYRHSLLKEVSSEFDLALEDLRTLGRENTKQTEALLKQVRQLDEARKLITRQVPVWPFNIQSFRKFFSLSLSPLIPAILSVVTDWIQAFLTGIAAP